jgi:hypothetical protein
MDMIGMTLRSMGFDPEVVLGQFKALGEAFTQLGVRLEGIEARLTQIEQSQIALLTHLGLFVPPSLEMMTLIEAESKSIVERVHVGGAAQSG